MEEMENRPKVKLDREYSCIWIEELKWLTDHGIRYTFVKEVNGTVSYTHLTLPTIRLV